MPKGRGLASIGESGWRFLLAAYGDVHQCQATETRRCDFFWLRARTAAEEGTCHCADTVARQHLFACRYFLHRLTLLFPARRTPAGTELIQKHGDPPVCMGKLEFFRTVFGGGWLGVSGAGVAVAPILRVSVSVSCWAGRGRVGVMPPDDTINIPRGKL